MIQNIAPANRAADQAEQLIAQLFHDLTQPLTSLHCCLELAFQKMPRSSKFRADLQVALQEAEKLTELVGELRELVIADIAKRGSTHGRQFRNLRRHSPGPRAVTDNS